MYGNELSVKIVEKMRENGISMQELCKMLNTSYGGFAGMLHNGFSYKSKYLPKLAKIFNCKVEDLVDPNLIYNSVPQKKAISNRIKNELKKRGLSYSDLSRMLNISRQRISMVLNEGLDVNSELIDKIADAIYVSPQYLRSGDESLKNQNIQVLENKNNAPINVVDAEISINDNETYKITPYIDYENKIYDNSSVYIKKDLIKDLDNVICVKLSDDSMFPEYQKNDIVLIKKDTSMDDRKVRAVKINDGKMQLRYIHYDFKEMVLSSYAANNEDTIFYGQNDNKLEIIGKVIYLWRNIGD